MSRFPLSEGVFIYLLGLVVIATHPGRFWLGFALAALPVIAGVALRTYDAARHGRLLPRLGTRPRTTDGTIGCVSVVSVCDD
jgi:hypothetical protein